VQYLSDFQVEAALNARRKCNQFYAFDLTVEVMSILFFDSQTALLSHFKPHSTEVSVTGFLGVLGAVMAAIVFFVFIARWFGKFAFI
jgi:hypothetical protein